MSVESAELAKRNETGDSAQSSESSPARAATAGTVANGDAQESHIQLSSDTFRNVAKYAPYGMFSADVEGHVTFANDRMLEMLDLPREGILDFHWVGRLHDEDRDEVLNRLRGAAETGSPLSLRCRITSSGGDVRNVRFRANPILVPESEEVAGWHGSLEDVSEDADAVQRVQRLSAICENTIDFVGIGQITGKVLYLNRSARDLLGLGIDETIDDMHGLGFFPEWAQHIVAHEGIEALVRDGVYTAELAFVKRNGEEFPVSLVLLAHYDVNGEIESISTIARDITSEKEAARVLARSEAWFRSIVQHSSDLVVICDAQGAITYASPSAARILGYEPGALFAKKFVDLMHPDDLDEARTSLGGLGGPSSTTTPAEVRCKHIDGRWVALEMVATNLLDDPDVSGIVINARDISERIEAEKERRHSEERFGALVQHASDVITVITLSGEILYTSPATERVLGMGTGLDLFSDPRKFIHEDDLERVSVTFAEQFSTPGVGVPVELRARHADGTWRHLELVANNLAHDPAIGGIVLTIRDITERRRAEELISEQAGILEGIAKGADLTETLGSVAAVIEKHSDCDACAIMLIDEDEGRLTVGAAPSLSGEFVRGLDGILAGPSAASCGTAAYRAQGVVVTDIANDPLWADYRDLAAAHGLSACWSTPILSSNGARVLATCDLYYREARAPVSKDERVAALSAQLAAIAIERKTFDAELAHQALHDPLTGLPNRALFVDRLELALNRARRHRSNVGVIFLDLDRFKVVNDSLGHDLGDQLLIAMAQRLGTTVRPGDTVARFGGDEFTVLCEDLSGEDSRNSTIAIADRLLEAINEPFNLGGNEVFLGGSIGIALATDPSASPEALLRDADAAMYHAKENGKGRWEVFDERMRSRVLERLATENALHRAIERGEFTVFYQPVFALRDARCVAVEALVRWQHPERGLVPPIEFITMAEETGLIVPLGLLVLEQACQQAADWQERYRQAVADDPEKIGAPAHFEVAVNLSARQLAQPDLVAQIAEAINKAGIDPACLCLEITESVLMDDAASTIGALENIKALGVSLSIDDFGTGYSSLGYLKRFPVDFVKVDRSFVDGLGSDPEDSAIVAAVVNLGHTLGLKVVAEGVETVGQLRELELLNCDYAQGYYFSPPKPHDDIADMIGRRRPWRNQVTKQAAAPSQEVPGS